MTTSLNLNVTELLVLSALNKSAKAYTGGQFGFMPLVDRCGLNDKQFAGYISALENKGVFEYNDKTGGTYKGQYAINTDFK